MELIVINENKLKIIMSAQEMTEFGLDENEFHLSMTDTKQILAKILNKFNAKTGFEEIAQNDKLLLQLYTDTHGGCELFVTRIMLDCEEEFFMPQGDERFLLPRSTKKTTEHKKTPITYSFEHLNHVVCACRELKARNFAGDSALYRLDAGKYYLVVEQDGVGNTSFSCLSEFGDLENTEYCLLNSLERGSCIFKNNAVLKLALM